MHEAFTLARLAAPRTGVRRRADGRVLQQHRRRDPDRRSARSRTEPDAEARRRDRRAARAGAAAGARARHRRLGRRRRGGGPAARRGGRPARPSPTAWGAASYPVGTRCWSPRPASAALGGADLVVVVGTPLDFRLGYGVFGGEGRRRTPARVVHLADSAGQVSQHADLAGEASGDLTLVLDGLRDGARRAGRAGPTGSAGSAGLQDTVRAGRRPATPSCSAPRPTRSTRPGSTASWSPAWPTTRS